MADFFTDTLHVLPASDTLATDSLQLFQQPLLPEASVGDSISGTFLQSAPVKLEPVLRETFSGGWHFQAVLILWAVMAVLWFATPYRESLLRLLRRPFSITPDSTEQPPGLLTPLLFYLNYLASGYWLTVLFLESTETLRLIELAHTAGTVFVIFNLYRLVFIWLTGFVFNTRRMAEQQLKLYVQVDNLAGFLLLPLLVLILYTGFGLFYLAAVLLLAASLVKWIQTILIGKSTSRFSVYHLIVYLCTLEIIPFLLLLKVLFSLGL